MKEYRQGEFIFITKCHKLCPKECKVQYFQTIKESENPFISKDYHGRTLQRVYERRIVWDSSEPMFAYTDEPDLTFTEYLVHCGGVMGLWFGQSAKDLISNLIDISFWRLLWSSIKNAFLYLKQLFLLIAIQLLTSCKPNYFRLRIFIRHLLYIKCNILAR